LSHENGKLSEEDNIEIRKVAISCIVKLFSNTKFKNMIEPSQFTLMSFCCLDNSEIVRNHLLIKLIQGLFGLKKSVGMPAVLSPMWCVLLCLYAPENNREMRTTATSALTRYLQGVRKKLTKQPMVMESFTPHLVHILLRLPVVMKKNDPDSIKNLAQMWIECLLTGDKKEQIQRGAHCIKILEELKSWEIIADRN